MNYKYIILVGLFTVYSLTNIVCGKDSDEDSDHHDTDHHDTDHHDTDHHDADHHDSDVPGHDDDSHSDDPHDDDTHHDDDFEPHGFDHDPHDNDSDYDEDVLTGTSHHDTKKSKEESKTEIDGIFKKADKNNDGKIEKAELKLLVLENMKKLHNESTEEEFRKIDKNKDSKATMDEYLIYHHDKTESVLDNLTRTDNSTKTLKLLKRINKEKERFKVADGNGDGSLTNHEYLLMKYPIFYPHMAHTVVHEYINDLDANRDGMVDKSEYTDHFQIVDHKNRTREKESLKKNQADFDKYDKDKNGKIDPEEYFAILKPGYEEPVRSEVEHLFSKTDGDKDGSLSLEEVEKRSHLWIGSDVLGENDDPHHYEDEL